MGIVHYKLPVNRMRCDNYVRLDTKYRFFSDVRQFVVWNKSDNIALGSVLQPLESLKKKKGELDDDYKLVELQNIERCGNSLIDVETVSEIGSDKVIIQNGDIIIPKIEPQKGQFFLNEQHQQFLGSSELIEYTINKDLYNPLFLYYVLVNPKVLKCLSFLESGKAHQRVSSDDLLKIKIPKVQLTLQNCVVEQIKPIEQDISVLKSSKTPHIDIINEVFGQEFGFDWKKFESLKRQKTYVINYSKINTSADFRVTTKFHSIKYNFLNLPIFQCHKFGDFAKFMTLGRQIQPEFFVEESDYYYLMPSAIKNNELEENAMKCIAKSFFDKFSHISLKKNDLVIAASGEGTIGKSAIYNSDLNAVCSQFLMKIELTDISLVKYFHYYMLSSYFLLTVEKYKKGMGNMTNIFVSQVENFPILYDQNKVDVIVSKIETRINAQKNIDKQIADKRQEISRLIESAIKQV